tara:strand:+ start:235 stop:696 length:462 start_codon:yes stop_codon:yes gene_type:complete
MPNWCSNSLVISTNTEVDIDKAREQLKEFRDSAKLIEEDGTEASSMSMNNLYPMPKELENTKSPSDKPNWYDWRCDNWGTKWDVEGCLEYDDEDYLEYSFQSAWSPPTAFLEKVSKDFPLLRFRLKYEEEGNGFLGVAVATNGHLNDQCIEYY